MEEDFKGHAWAVHAYCAQKAWTICMNDTLHYWFVRRRKDSQS